MAEIRPNWISFDKFLIDTHQSIDNLPLSNAYLPDTGYGPSIRKDIYTKPHKKHKKVKSESD